VEEKKDHLRSRTNLAKYQSLTTAMTFVLSIKGVVEKQFKCSAEAITTRKL
jgi:hypothetical protein